MLKAGSGTLETSPNPYSFSASPSFESNAITAGAFELENVPSRGVKREIRDEASQRNEEEETKRQRTTGDTMMNTTPALSIAPPHPHHYIPSLYEDGTGEISPTVATASSIVRSFSSVLDPSLRPSRPLTAPLARATFATSPLSATFPPASYIYPSEPMTSGLGLDASAVSTQVGRGGANARSRSRTRSPVHPNVAKAKGATVSVTGGQAEKACTSCGTTNSPEWRKGPSSSKELCNACGASRFHLLTVLCTCTDLQRQKDYGTLDRKPSLIKSRRRRRNHMPLYHLVLLLGNLIDRYPLLPPLHSRTPISARLPLQRSTTPIHSQRLITRRFYLRSRCTLTRHLIILVSSSNINSNNRGIPPPYITRQWRRRPFPRFIDPVQRIIRSTLATRCHTFLLANSSTIMTVG